jgi:hypothetical protein
MRFYKYLVGVLIVVSQVLPAAALTKRVDPLPRPPEYPIDCRYLLNQESAQYTPCVPPNIDPRFIDAPHPPGPNPINCCHTVIIPPPHVWRAPMINTAPE